MTTAKINSFYLELQHRISLLWNSMREEKSLRKDGIHHQVHHNQVYYHVDHKKRDIRGKRNKFAIHAVFDSRTQNCWWVWGFFIPTILRFFLDDDPDEDDPSCSLLQKWSIRGERWIQFCLQQWQWFRHDTHTHISFLFSLIIINSVSPPSSSSHHHHSFPILTSSRNHTEGKEKWVDRNHWYKSFNEVPSDPNTIYSSELIASLSNAVFSSLQATLIASFSLLQLNFIPKMSLHFFLFQSYFSFSHQLERRISFIYQGSFHWRERHHERERETGEKDKDSFSSLPDYFLGSLVSKRFLGFRG